MICPGPNGASRVVRFVDFVNDQQQAYDDYGHGTHVAGIIAGNGSDSGGARAGIAPAARLVVLKVLDGSGQGNISDVIAALDYAVEHRDELNIGVINLSVATGVYESYETDPLTVAARRAVNAGIVVVTAAGNNGKNAQGITSYAGVTAPGNAPWVLTVGASSHMGTHRSRRTMRLPPSAHADRPPSTSPRSRTSSRRASASSPWRRRAASCIQPVVRTCSKARFRARIFLI